MTSPSAGPTPRFSVLTPVYDPPLTLLQEAIDSVRAQSFRDWQLVLVDDRSTDPGVREVLRRNAAEDPRIVVVERETNGHISAASNDALAAATGEFVALLDHDDLLASHALERVDEVLDTYDDIDYVYSDEDKTLDGETFVDRFVKPDWSPERLRGQMYCGHLSVMRRSVVEAVGAFRIGLEGSQDHDLALRVGEVARRVVHVPEVLYHWRVLPGSTAGSSDAKDYYTWDAGLRAVQDHLDRVEPGARAERNLAPHTYRLHRTLDPAHRVSIVIPTIGSTGLVWGERRSFVLEAVRSVLTTTGHRDLEIVVVYDPPTPPETLQALRDLVGDRLRLVPYSGPFDFSRKVNTGVLASTGSRLVLLNDDVQASSATWLEDLVGPLDDPTVGLTGARLLFGDGRVQHAGHRYADGEFLHAFYEYPREAFGPYGELILNRECAGVTAACAAIRRDTFFEVGGMSETLPVNFNDVDLSLKVRMVGKRVLWIATSELYHFETRSRPRTVEPWEAVVAYTRWGVPKADPYLPTTPW